MDRIWLSQYPPGVPTDIDADEYASIRDIFTEACSSYGNKPAFVNMGATLTFAQLDALTAAFAAWLQKKSGLSAGDRVPADMRVVQASSDLRFDRSLLTGERSVPCPTCLNLAKV